MAYLRLIDVGEAAGIMGEEYEAAIERAGKVFNVVKSMSLSPGRCGRRCACTARSCTASPS